MGVLSPKEIERYRESQNFFYASWIDGKAVQLWIPYHPAALHHQYGFSVRRIAKECGIGHNSMANIFRHYNIPILSRSEVAVGAAYHALRTTGKRDQITSGNADVTILERSKSAKVLSEADENGIGAIPVADKKRMIKVYDKIAASAVEGDVYAQIAKKTSINEARVKAFFDKYFSQAEAYTSICVDVGNDNLTDKYKGRNKHGTGIPGRNTHISSRVVDSIAPVFDDDSED